MLKNYHLIRTHLSTYTRGYKFENKGIIASAANHM